MCDRSHLSKGSQLPVSSLCKTIRALVAKGDHATKKAEQFYTAAGKHLAELKERCPDEWLQYASEKIGIGRSRAYELMAIGTGTRSVGQIRESTRKRVENHRSPTVEHVIGRCFQGRAVAGWQRISAASTPQRSKRYLSLRPNVTKRFRNGHASSEQSVHSRANTCVHSRANRTSELNL
jgi:hypothetical protein